MQSKARSKHRKIEHGTKTGPSGHITSARQSDCATRNETLTRHAHSKNGPRTASSAHAAEGCRTPRSKSSKAKRKQKDLVALKARLHKRAPKAVRERGARALLFETTAGAGDTLHLLISAVILSHHGLQGYGYKVHYHHPCPSLMGNWGSKGAHNPHLLMRHTFCGAFRSNPTIRSSAMKVVSRPCALGTTIFDDANRAAP